MGRWKLLEFLNPDQEISEQAVTKGGYFIPEPTPDFSPSLSAIDPPFLGDCPCHRLLQWKGTYWLVQARYQTGYPRPNAG